MCKYVRYTDVFWHQSTYLETHCDILRRACTCARECAFCSLAFGNECCRVRLVSALVMPWDIVIQMRKNRVLSVFSTFFWREWDYLWVYVCVYTHIHSQCKWGTQMWAQGSRQDTWRGDRLKHARRRDAILKWQLFFFSIFSFRKRKAKCMNVTPRTGNHIHLSYIDPQSRVLNYL